jgi:hypothetical protein
VDEDSSKLRTPERNNNNNNNNILNRKQIEKKKGELGQERTTENKKQTNGIRCREYRR